MHMRFALFICFVAGSLLCPGQPETEIRHISLEPGEKVWAGVINDGHLMPFSTDYSMDFYGNNKANQLQPLLLTSYGRFLWSEQPFSFELKAGEIIIHDPFRGVIAGKQGATLAEAQRYVRQTFFPSAGKLPDTLLFSRPQYNTWIELTYHQNQADVLKYARGILDHGFPPGVIMIDDTWQEDYGLWNFHPGRFPDPEEMVEELHRMGFKVMLWICPFVSADQTMIYSRLKESKAFILERTAETDTWESLQKPLMVEWWNGQSAVLDFSNPAAVEWFNQQLDRLVNDYGIDGFKFDAGDMYFYPPQGMSMGNFSPNEHCESFARFGLRYPLNEYRACWKMGGQPLAQRLQDKSHSWEDLRKLIPDMILEGLCGYPFSCPDMIGGGEWTSFLDPSRLDPELIVRSAQCHALMPMMQFSVAPWRVLDSAYLTAVLDAVELREKFTPLIMQLVHEAAATGEPVMKCMEYEFPGQGFQDTKDQFMLGHDILVAPVLEKGKTTRNVRLPEGKWKAADGKILKGGKTCEMQVVLNQLLYFERVK